MAAALVAAAFGGLMCGCGGSSGNRPDGGRGGSGGGGKGGSSSSFDGGDASRVETGAVAIGQPCASPSQCASGFCADGVCCKTDCSGACLTCAATGSVGVCIPADVGTDPRNDCTDLGAASCQTDGFCDGAGACEIYAAGVACQASGCSGSTLVFAGLCDGAGTCLTKPSQSCAPYSCNSTGQCKTTCMADADCVAPTTCQSGSCGRKPIGAGCSADTDCNSGICAQGACCSTTCTGTCKSCNLSAGLAGNCTNVPAGQDPLQQCADSGAASCGTDGLCDGTGSCQLYAMGTVCGADSCTGGTETQGGRCDGKGVCAAGGLLACSPYVCGPSGDCTASCATTADCAAGFACNGTICGKKPLGVTCSAAAECGSGYCEQGVCCNTGCEATCQACNLAGTIGTCTPVPAGADPLAQCTDAGAPSCKNDGSCDGAGKCRNYASGTVCTAQTCAGSTLAAAGRCNGTGTCVPGASQSCAPYACGAGACLTTCGGATDCVSPNVCAAGSCGKSPIGAACAANTDCGSGFCAQGFCCNAACTGTCQSCALPSSVGTCTNVPAGQDPLAQCADAGAPSCGNNGFCNGAGACQKYASGTQCAAATCVGASFTPPSLCDGAGTCTPATSSPCGAYACDASNRVCKTTCLSNADCTGLNVCNGGSCTLQPLNTACTMATQCASGFCQQGVCCASSCTGGCASCALAGTGGTCTNVPPGADPLNACTDGGAAACGNDGTCDGSGKCRLYAGGTVCASATCAGSTFTPARSCDGSGNCKTVTASLCTPFACDTTNNVCKTTCATSADCASPNSCNTTTKSCGLASNGAACAADTTCNSGHCQQGVCCATVCTATCSSCAVAGSPGTCVAVPAGQDPLNQCSDAGAASCGQNGFCDGGGHCQRYASGTPCIAQTCTTSTLHPASTCNGTGTCVTPATSSCTPYICGPNACKTTCATSADCFSAAYTCSGGTCIQAANLTVKTKTVSSAAADIYFDIQIINNGPSVVPLSQLTVKYWYTYDTPPAVVTQTASCTYANGVPGNCGGTTIGTGNFVAVSPARTKADFVFTFGFTTAAGNLAAGATAEIGPGFNKNNFTSYTQTNDYSYNPSTAFTVSTTVTVYLGGVLVYGTEPM